MNEIIPEINKRLIEFRKKMKLSQQEIADTAQISRAYITQVETGRVNPSFKLLHKILLNYNLSINWLLSGKGEMIVSDNSIINEMTEEHYKLVKKLLEFDIKKQSKLINGFIDIIETD